MLTRRFLPLLTVLLLLAASCGDDGPSAAEDQDAADEVIAALEERLEEEGFERAADDDDDDDDLQFESEECKEFAEAFPEEDEDLPGETASADSRDFERGEVGLEGGVQETVQASVGFVEEEDDLDPVFELLNDDRLPDCLNEALTGFLEQSAAEEGGQFEFSGFEAERVTPSGLGDDAGRIALEGGITVQGFQFAFIFDIEMVRVGRTAAMVMYGAFGGPDAEIDEEQRVAVLEGLVESLEDA